MKEPKFYIYLSDAESLIELIRSAPFVVWNTKRSISYSKTLKQIESAKKKLNKLTSKEERNEKVQSL